MRVLGGEAVGVLVHVERADQHRPGLLEALDEHRIGHGRRMIAVDLRAGERAEASDVEEVLHRIGHAGERSGIFTRRQRPIDFAGFLERPLRGERREAVEGAVALLDIEQRVTGELRRGKTLLADPGGKTERGAVVPGRGVGTRHGSKTGAISLLSGSGNAMTSAAKPAIRSKF